MAQASSAQREPSMEEILASIRRIIEDSDTQRGQGQTPAVGAEPERAVPLARTAPSAVVQVNAFRGERTEPLGAKTPESAEATAHQEPVVPAGEEARIEHAAERLTDFSGEDLHRSGDFVKSPIAPAQDSSSVPVESAAPVAEALPVEGYFAGAGEGDARAEADSAATATSGEERSPTLGMPALHPDESWMPLEALSTKEGIMSERPGRQVAAAFDELSDVFAASRKKSFDEMAEEMMRPMLQDWLDNNLPLLVERLVREEIERVARGVR